MMDDQPLFTPSHRRTTHAPVVHHWLYIMYSISIEDEEWESRHNPWEMEP